eukprot:m.48899 g.48899  ORF g.48899 m.48899 type:complete len:634 (+) comp12770_c0_seq1:253-2154(+)
MEKNVVRQHLARSDVPEVQLDSIHVPSLDELLDLLGTVYDECRSSKQTDASNLFCAQYGPCVALLRKDRTTLADFELRKKIAEGSVADIFLAVHNKYPHVALAMKCMNKTDVISRSQSVCFREELELLSKCAELRKDSKSPIHTVLPIGGLDGITHLKFAFHDALRLYLATEFYPGGDLLGLLGKYEVFPEEMARFYIAELVLAVETVHELGYAHRDIKVENLLLNARGHLFLGDFGSCARLDSKGYVSAEKSALAGGTPDYLSPELLRAIQGDTAVRYSASCDWWAVGVVLYEFLTGETPFFNDSVLRLYRNIAEHETTLKFRDNIAMSAAAKDLIRKLLTKQDARLGRGGAKEIKEHPFFENVQWDRLRDSRAPFTPELASNMDTALFDTEEYDKSGSSSPTRLTKSESFSYQIAAFPFIGYYYASSLSSGDNTSSDDTPKKTASFRLRRRNSDGKFSLKRPTTSPSKLGQAADASAETQRRRSSFKAANAAAATKLHVHFPPEVMFLDAAKTGDLVGAARLLEGKKISGVDIESGSGLTALMIASQNGHLHLVEYLLDQNANIHATAVDGCTSLHLAVLEEQDAVAALLMQRGADPLAKNVDNETPYDWAADNETLKEVVRPRTKAAVVL